MSAISPLGHDEIPTLAHLLPWHARERPNAPAVVFGDRQLDFSQLDRRSNQVANAIMGEGLVPGSRVAVLDRNNELFFEILFGAAKAGAVLVTVNFRLKADEIHYILADSEAEILFVGAEYAAEAEKAAEALPRPRRVVVMDGYDASAYAAWRDRYPDANPGLRIEPESAAVQMYTSGTTGNPKGVELSHRAMVAAAIAGLGVWPYLYEPGAAVLGTMPLFHIAAANLCIAALFAGARAEILRESSAEQLARILVERRIFLVPVPAALIHEMLRTPGVRDFDFSALKTMLVAGSGISVELLREAQQVFGCGFALSYGSTETCGGLTYLGPQECRYDAGDLLRSAGRVLAHSRIRIVDEQGRDLPCGQTGEIVCRTDRLMNGYWHRPEATAEAIRDGWYHSGDAGYMDENGYLYVVDRIKDMVISGGENIYPAEVELALRKHPGVDDVAIIGVPDPKWGESLMAFVIPRPGAGLDGSELEAFLKERIAGYKVPRRYCFVENFPRNATGKVLKRELRRSEWTSRAGAGR